MSEEEEEPRWTPEERHRLRRAVARRRARAVTAGQVFAGAVGTVAAAGVLLRLPPEWWVPAVGAGAVGGLVVRIALWTCPSCGERLPTRRSSETCPGCGLPLD